MNINHVPKFTGFLSLLKPYKLDLISGLIALLIVTGSILGLGQALKVMINNGFSNNGNHDLNLIFAAVILIIICLSIASFMRASKVNLLCDKIEIDIKNLVYNHIIYLAPGFFEVNKTSDVITRVSMDCNIISTVLTNIASSVLRNLLILIGGMIFLFSCSSKLTICLIIAVPLVIIPVIIMAKKIRILSRKTQDQLSLVNAHIEETINGIKTVQAFARERYETERFSGLLTSMLQISRTRLVARAILAAMVIFIVLSSVALVLWIGSHDVIKGYMTVGDLTSFIYYSILVATSAASVIDSYSEIQRVKAAWERISELLNARSSIENSSQAYELVANIIPTIQFQKVSFSYPARPNELAIKDTDIFINTGEYIALVGPSGSGKSTIFQLLMRFYDPQHGQILLNNHNIKDIKIDNLREQFAFMPQESVIFSASAYDNILFGSPYASKEQVYEAAKQAEIYDFIQGLPQKFDTFLGEKGVRISGGQKQRIAIARALLKNAPILLFDEATSSLDSENEQMVQQYLNYLRGKKTILVISHRIATVKNADRIIVLHNGKIEAIGTHEDLYKNNDLYLKLAQNQLN